MELNKSIEFMRTQNELIDQQQFLLEKYRSALFRILREHSEITVPYEVYNENENIDFTQERIGDEIVIKIDDVSNITTKNSMKLININLKKIGKL